MTVVSTAACPGAAAHPTYRARSAPPLPIRSRAPRSVLIVEDDPVLQRAMADHLRATGAEVMVASHFASARRQLATRIPDLACIDIGLPTESGYELCELIRGPLGLAFLPILVTSAFGSPREMALAEDAGANAFLLKRFSMARLAAHVDAMIDGVWPGAMKSTPLAIMGAREPGAAVASCAGAKRRPAARHVLSP